MGYSFYLLSKEKEISQKDFDTAISNLSKFNQQGHVGFPPCDIDFKKHYIRVFGSFGVSGQYAEGFVLNLLMCLLELGYKPKVISKDWGYGTDEDFNWIYEPKIQNESCTLVDIDTLSNDEQITELIRSKSQLYTAYSVKDKEGKYRSVVDIESVIELIRDIVKN